jgi:hypothetical protein
MINDHTHAWETIMAHTPTPEEIEKAESYRQQARDSRKRAHDSFERSDTDGFLSQWANDITARELEMKAELIEMGGVVERPALFDLDGNLVLAKEIETQYGYAWAILDPENPRGRFLGFFNESKAKNPERKRATDARKGYYVGSAMVKGYVKIVASGTGLSGAASAYPAILSWRNEETGAPEIVEIVDNGQDD